MSRGILTPQRWALALLSAALLAACGQEPAPTAAPEAASSAKLSADAIRAKVANVDEAAIVAADPSNWLTHGRTYDEQRHSPLAQINADNVGELGLAWYWDTGTTRGLEATPIVVDGVMFTTGTWSTVFAHDARTGELLWKYDPEVPREWGVYACCDVVNRGVAAWKGRIYVGTLDGRLVALDAGTGQPDWSVQTTPKDRPYTITGAPRVVDGKVIIGNGGSEYGVRGFITAYDADTGDQAWRFYTVPGNPDDPIEGEHLKAAMSSWRGGEWWKVGGGGTVWDSMAYDPDLNLLYIGVGNGAPWNRHIRSPGGGDNLYLSSIVAINPDDGSLVWHYQTTPGDSWDYTATQHMILTELEVKGERRKVIMQAPKNGFFYVLDRETGEFLSAEAYVPITWASHVDPETGRPVENPGAAYAEKPALTMPAPYGGHNWHPMTYSPSTNLVYIPALDLPFMYGQDNAFRYNPATWNTGVEFALTIPPDSITEEVALRAMVKGHLAAWDPVAQREVWRVQHSGSWNGGLLSTSGDLLFQGRADGMFAAYQASTGALLWETPVHTGIIAAPVTWAVDGEQYVTVVAGWGGAFGVASGIPAQDGNVIRGGRILTYKLGANGTLPTPPMPEALPTPPPMTASADTVDQGELLYHQNCSVCHGGGAVSSGVLPDLRYMSEQTHQIFQGIVLGGAYKEKGMVSFSHVLDSDGAEAIHAYLIKRGHDAMEERRLLAEQARSDSTPAGG
ncbi:MAG: PQQ-dependent dehydrogenase, methanol/ethanol family [Pseudomonadales bacterium]|nr:PQQ-dependent dehydrogenase, methanol/ethanol family [Pseudomonadales bacterium]MBL6807923.1 PQQ-dependent dehydrogenase, methanol/ethanol family [Pseudomonadales bacterium]